MSDARSLRHQLEQLDMTAPSIQAAAGAMLKHYEKTAAVALNEWRNSLHNATNVKLLPLLYVANEVLQTSKRNRGNKFLEVFSPHLKESLVYVCQKDPTATEKVRRTVKVWGDRQVFSLRFINELMQALEPYREGVKKAREGVKKAQEGGPTFSPMQISDESPKQPRAAAGMSKSSNSDHTNQVVDVDNDDEEQDDDDDIMKILNDTGDNSSTGSNDSDMFGDDQPQSQKLDLDITISVSPQQEKQQPHKRRRAGASRANGPKRRRSQALTINTLLDLWNRLVDAQQSFTHSQSSLQKIDTTIEKSTDAELEALVGDELQATYRQHNLYVDQIASGRVGMHDTATKLKALEGQAIQYIPWLELALKQDEEDLEFCDSLEQKIVSFRQLHEQVRQARNVRRLEENQRRQAEENEERKRKEREESERFRKAALARTTEAEPGMIWDPNEREYVKIRTDESWRDK
jgi:hypothetical protein